MAAKNPLAGIPVITSTPTGPAPTNIKSKRKHTGQAYKDARDQSRNLTGYNNKSPIWGKPTIDVLTTIGNALNPGGRVDSDVNEALALNEELRKRFLSYKLTSEELKKS